MKTSEKYKLIKDAVNMEDVLERYTGVKVRNRRCACPIHDGKHDSFSFTENTFHCFKCGAKGDIISFVAVLYGISNYEAALKIDRDFGLGIFDKDYKPRTKTICKVKKEIQTKAIHADRHKDTVEEYEELTDALADNRFILRCCWNVAKAKDEITDELKFFADRQTELEYLTEEVWERLIREGEA